MTNINEVILAVKDYEDKKTLDLFERIGDVKAKGFLTKEHAIAILKWKSPRPLIPYEINTDQDFEDMTLLAFKSNGDKAKMNILTTLSGVSYPSASALLMFFDKEVYPVIDIRVWKELYRFGLLEKNERGQGFTLSQWIDYLKVIRTLAKEHKLSARQIEKRLFDYSKKNQEGTLYRNYK
ncbi:MAG TPA: hypothetical protein VF679_00835 [Pedobacter sp.]